MKIQKVTIKGLVRKDDKIFMLRDPRGNWELPGGRMEFGEDFDQTLKREFEEEMGVSKVEKGEIVYAFNINQAHHDGDEYHFIVLIFECSADLGQVKISDEHTESAWLGLADIADYPMKEGYQKLLQKVLK